MGSSPVLVTDLGRWVKSGNTQSHTVKLVAASTGGDIPGASVTINTSGATAGQFAYATLAAPATWTNSKETHYLYDGMLVVQERDASNNPQVSYTRGKDLSGSRRGAGGIGGLLAYTGGGVSQYYHSDGLGNVTALANVNNQLSAAYNYDPYGNLLGSSGPMADLNHYRFSSKEIHSGSGTYAYGFRFYDPSLQRWLNRDPIEESGGINLYGLVGNRPTEMIDPVGFYWWTDMSYGVFGWVWNPFTVIPTKYRGTDIDGRIGEFNIDNPPISPSSVPTAGNTSAVNTIAQITADSANGYLNTCPMPKMTVAGGVFLFKNGGISADKCTASGLPAVVKAVHSELAHAVERAVERGVFPTAEAATDALRALS